MRRWGWLLVVATAMAACSDEPTAGSDSSKAIDAGTVAPCVCDSEKDTACVQHRCDATGVCVPYARAPGTPCDDGDPCSAGDVCAIVDGTGTCKAGPHSRCSCLADTDCTGQADPCAGTMVCDKVALPWRCAIKAGSAIQCPDGGPCQVNACEPKTGKCATTLAAPGSACDDGDACTIGDACKTTGGANPSSTCSGLPACECATDKDCDNGNKCRQRICDKTGHCKVVPKSVVQCGTSNVPCQVQACRPWTGVCSTVAAPSGQACDDGDKCTTGDACAGGQCAAGKNTCTCAADKDCAALDDGDLCNGVPVCNKASGTCIANKASVVSCPTVNDVACVHTACAPKTGKCTPMARDAVTPACVTTKQAVGPPLTVCKWVIKKPNDPVHADTGPYPCDDNDPCTTGGTCAGKLCKAAGVTCNCKTDADCEKADDGDLCNGTWYCNKALKVADCTFNPASKVYCSPKDDTTCLAATCNPKTGACALQPHNTGKACDDGNACTHGSKCLANGACVGAKLGCNDGNPCTADSCTPKAGCAHSVGAGLCDDGDLCTDKDVCSKGTCTGSPRVCDDGNDCTSDACDDKTGTCALTKLADGKLCNADDNGCTVNDSCKVGVCIAGAQLTCTNKVAPCQVASCQSLSPLDFKCVAVLATNGTACPDKKGSCLIGASCEEGVCQPGQDNGRFSLTLAHPGRNARFTALDQHPDGWLTAAGQSWSASKTDQRWYVVRVTRTAAVKWQWSLPTDGVSSPWHEARGVVALADTTAWIGGTVVAKDKKMRARIARLSASGKVLQTQDFASLKGHDLRLIRLKRGPLDTLFIVAVDDGDSKAVNGTTQLFRLDATGQQLWRRDGLSAHKAASPAVALFSNGHVYHRSSQRNATTSSEHAFWMEEQSGKKLHTTDFGASTYTYTADAVAGADQHAWILYGGGSKRSTFLARGQAGTQRAKEVAQQRRGVCVTGSAAGGVWIAGHSDADNTSSNRRPWLARVDQLMNVQWQRTLGLPVGTSGRISDLVELADGNLAWTGHQTDANGTSKAWLAAANAWGDVACGTGGACETVLLGDCDDNKPCTRDFCNAAVGCQNVADDKFECPAPTTCSDSGTCSKGTCVGSAAGRYRIASISGGPRVAGLTRVGSDSIKVLAKSPTAKGLLEQRTFVTERARVIGSPTSRHNDPCPATWADHYTPHPGGFETLAGDQQIGGTTRMVFCGNQSHALNGFAVALDGGCSSCAGHGRDTSATPTGTVFGVGSQPGYKGGSASFVRIDVDQLAAGTKAKFSRWHVSKASTQLDPYCVTTLSDATSFVGGEAKVGVKTSGWLARMSHDGKVHWHAVLAPKGLAAANGSIRELAPVNDKLAVAVGFSWVNTYARRSWMLGVTGDGKVIWNRSPTHWDGILLNNVATVAGGFFISGDRQTTSGTRIVAARTGPQGEPVWQHTYVSDTKLDTWSVRGVAIGGLDGGYFLGATTDSAVASMVGKALLYRIGPWGEISCKTAGACKTKVSTDCDDGKACTADLCDPSTGCVHTALPGCQG